MEDHPSHAVTNNLFGTKSIADAALAVGAERFVMVSTDKAVNPTSVMGATKRWRALRPVAARDRPAAWPAAADHGTQFSMVRFGNVLGSACSVLTIWSAQLAEGGPVTVTDPRMTAFFMTIPEAATLVIQAGGNGLPEAPPPSTSWTWASHSRSLDLAKRFVRAHGFEPRVVGDAAARKRHAPHARHRLLRHPPRREALRGALLRRRVAPPHHAPRHPGLGRHHACAPNCAGLIADLSPCVPRATARRSSRLSGVTCPR
jgi:nucleoside-diphosphate-sugar epimerase